MILAIDPGEVAGWAELSEDGEVIGYGQVKYDEFADWLLDHNNANTIVIENFRVRPGVNFNWSEMKTIKMIGMVEYFCTVHLIDLVFQEPSAYSIGLKWAGITLPKSHKDTHQYVAIAHGVYYSVKVLKNKLPILRRMAQDAQDAQDSTE